VDQVSGEEIWQLLERGGLRVESRTTESEDAGPPHIAKYNGFVDPNGAERLGALLAERARALGPNVVVWWENIEDAALAFIVGRELSVPVIRVINADGLVMPTSDLPPRPRAVLVGDAFTRAQVVVAMTALLNQQGGELAAVISLVDAGLGEVPVSVSALVDAPTDGND
jgi:hypothetical protein